MIFVTIVGELHNDIRWNLEKEDAFASLRIRERKEDFVLPPIL